MHTVQVVKHPIELCELLETPLTTSLKLLSPLMKMWNTKLLTPVAVIGSVVSEGSVMTTKHSFGPEHQRSLLSGLSLIIINHPGLNL